MELLQAYSKLEIKIKQQINTLILLSMGYSLFIFSSLQYKQQSWFYFLFFSRVVCTIAPLIGIGALVILKEKVKNIDTAVFTLCLGFQSILSILEGPTSTDFYNYTSILFIVSALATKAPISIWIKKYSFLQILFLVLPLFFKDPSYFSSLGMFVDKFTPQIVGLVLGVIVLKINGDRFLKIEENYNLHKLLNEKIKNELEMEKMNRISLARELDAAKKIIISESEYKAKSDLARQVAHDIRSPLSALNIIAGTLNDMPEEKRTLLRNATQRINDIANSLLIKAKEESLKKSDQFSLNIEMLSTTIDTLVSEKRTQFRNQVEIEIRTDLYKGYGLFSKINSQEFKRVLSNLINNSAESFPEQKGIITISLSSEKNYNVISIADNGAGMTTEILANVGKKGFTHGKNNSSSGCGLGLYHAHSTIESFGGEIQISSQPDQGTKINILLPKESPPPWFVEKINIKPNTQVVVLDDDQSIHNIWQGRLLSLGANHSEIDLKSFTHTDNFINWIQTENSLHSCLFLIDYEFLNQSSTGIDVILKMQIENQSILVTSRFEEPHLIEKCQQNNINIIPKTQAGLVPIEIY